MGSPAFYTMVLKYMKVGQHYYSTLLYLRMRAFGALTGVIAYVLISKYLPIHLVEPAPNGPAFNVILPITNIDS